MIVTIEYIDGTPDETHETVTEYFRTWYDVGYVTLLHDDESKTLVNLDAVRTISVQGRVV